MKLRSPEDHPDEDALDICPLCASDLDDDGDCPRCGNGTDRQREFEERRADWKMVT